MKITQYFSIKSKKNLKGIAFTAFLILFLVISAVQPVYADDSSSNSGSSSRFTMACKYPGQIIEAGEVVKFDITIKNVAGTNTPKKLRVDTFKGENDWEFKFIKNDMKIDRLSLEPGESDTVQLEVKTAGDTPVDTYQLRVSLDDAKLWLYIIIDKTHAGENGVLKLKIVNEQGDTIKGAKVSAFSDRKSNASTVVYSTSDGEVRTELVQGTYRLLVENDGYLSREKDDVVIQSGYTEDVGTLMLERKNFGLDIDTKAPVVTAQIGDKPIFEMKLSNVGKSDDTFTLSYEDMPDGWYGRYKEAADSTSEVSEVFIKAGEEKTVFFEVIPPYSVTKGDYTFKSDVISSDNSSYKTNLKATIKGSSDLEVFSEKYLYEVTKGETVEIPVKILNKGNGVALTNVRIEVSTPEGWKVTTSPETLPSIAPGKKDTVLLKVVPPSNIAASEYKITVKVVSDQNEVSDSIRIDVKENSLIGIFGILMIIIVGAGVYYMYRKYERR
ncbi:putative membrane protein [Methanomicrobium sp. W14]|uniref:NEW3 domain-containing protein n=1 Tax=Methanomicrobium sp. W14 TaxID=2817839 RepID=UPI001AE36377|nr:NEW3 domain-containing protein [Methanomicrobium sp. W14]MBP2134143.1 putative membrane protein [Methanomicrobium sp. W14]